MLNPTLFRLLEKRFGQGNVLVVNENVPMASAYSTVATARRASNARGKEYRKQLNVDSSGEEYRINCPFCNDTRHRLYLNHRWGLRDATSGTLNLWLAQCWNETACMSDYEARGQLYDMVYDSNARSHRPVLDKTPISKPAKLEEVRLPGAVWRLDDMLRRRPRHEAIQYVQQRLMDPLYLGKAFRVGYCPDASHRWVSRRLIAPIYMRHKLVGWQARCLGEPDDSGTPKWFTLPGMPRKLVLYNYDSGIQYQTKVLVEGPPDVWGFGRQAMGLIGKNVSEQQINILEKASQADDVIVVMLDPDRSPDAKLRNKPHHIETVALRLEARRKFKGRVLRVYLPEGTDPGELDREYMRDMIRYEADKANLPVSFKAAI